MSRLKEELRGQMSADESLGKLRTLIFLLNQEYNDDFGQEGPGEAVWKECTN